jgi:hypothetical protein
MQTVEAVLRERASATPVARQGAANAESRGPGVEPQDPFPIELGALQRWFASVMMHEQDVAAAMTAVEAPFLPAEVERVVLPSAALSPVERIAIYHGAYRQRLVECLADDYPAVQHALGDEEFERLCHAYIAEHPSRGPNLNSFGRHLPPFCRARAHPLSAFTADLGALEWAMVEVLHAPQAPPLSLTAIEPIPPSRWGNVRLTPSQAARLLTFSYPVNSYFQSWRTGEDPALPEPSWSSTVVYRDGPVIWRMNLDRPMATLLGGLFAGERLADALEKMAALPDLGDDAPGRVMGWFREWIGHGLFCALSLAPGEDGRQSDATLT